ncbi:MAG: glutathione S-transferase family protein [Polyangiales bacterium]
MPTLELISHPLCPFVHRAAALLTEKGVPFTQRFIDLKAKPDWFLAISPRGKVPVLVVDGAPIFESAVILEYLDETTAPHLVPSDPLTRARHRMWVELSNDLMAGHYKIAIATTPTARATAIASAREALQRFEQVVVGPWFAGDALGIVDFAAGPALVRFERLGKELGIDLYESLPKVAAWSKRITERPAFKDSLVADFDERFHALIQPAAA